MLRSAALLGLPIAVLAAACGQQRTAGTYGAHAQENTTVIGSESPSETAGEERLYVSGPTGEGDCVQISDSLCVPADTDGSDWCERDGGPVDIVIVEGKVQEVICYPPADDPERPTETVTSTDDDIAVVQSANNTTVVFADSTNGEPIDGDMSIDGNNVAVYGNGPDETIIDGDVTISGNNVRLRGVTVRGDLTIGLNSAAIVLSRVLGNVSISKNNTVFVENDVFGDLESSMNNTTLTGNDVEGAWRVTGRNDTCDANHAFSDINDDQIVDAAERGALLQCPSE